MKELLKKYMDEGNKSNALLIYKNLFHKNKGDKSIFSSYFSLLSDMADLNSAEAEDYIEQMVTVLSIYAENTELTENEVINIRNCEEKINNLVISLEKEKEFQKKEQYKEIINRNDELLYRVEGLISSLKEIRTRNDFEIAMKKISDIDNSMDKNNFVSRQQTKYEEFTKRYQNIVNLKMEEFERQDAIEYNQKAVSSYEKWFNVFKNSQKDSCSFRDIKELFMYDSSRLTNETLTYYNYVYTYIFSKLNDEEKLLLTKVAIITQKEVADKNVIE